MKKTLKVTEGMVEDCTAAVLVHFEKRLGIDVHDIDIQNTKEAVRVTLKAAQEYSTRR